MKIRTLSGALGIACMNTVPDRGYQIEYSSTGGKNVMTQIAVSDQREKLS